jgi:putative PIN family toxin of toxin-antitoxin system
MSAAGAPQAVLDTNVLLDFWVFDDARSTALRDAVEQGRVCALRSAACVDELSEVLARPKLGVDGAVRCEILRRWHTLATPVEQIYPAPYACTDPHDQKFLDLAHTVGADWLVTKDKALLKLARRAQRGGLRIVDPGATAALLAAR